MSGPSLASSTSTPLGDHLHRLHWSSLFFEAISQIRRIILPAIFGLLGAANGDVFWLWLSVIFIVPTLAVSLFRYLTLSYQVEDGQLIVKQGLIFRNVRSVPVERIQNIDFVQNLIHRMIGVAEVRVETAGGSEPEATLRVLSMEKIELLRSAVFESRQSISGMPDNSELENRGLVDTLGGSQVGYQPEDYEAVKLNSSTSTAPGQFDLGENQVQAKAADVTILEIPTSWLIKAGLASDRGLLLVGVAIGGIYESNILKLFDFNQLLKFLPQNPGVWILTAGAVVAFLLLYLVLKLLSAIWYVIRFSGYRLVRREHDLRISCGLTTKVHATVPRGRIQFISVHRGWMMRLMGFCSVRIETASAGSSHEDASKSVSSRWFIPVVAEDRLPDILEQVRPGIAWSESEFEFKSVSSKAVRRRVRLITLLALLLAVGLAFWKLWLIAGVSLLWILAILATVLQIRSMGFARTDQGVLFRNGVISKIVSITFFEKIQAITVNQSPMDRHWKMAKLTIDTAAAGPAEHRIDVPLLDEAFALTEMATITRLAAKHQPVFR
ncbi:MAG: PH domain-containing protein [Pirellulales bacterium]